MIFLTSALSLSVSVPNIATILSFSLSLCLLVRISIFLSVTLSFVFLYVLYYCDFFHSLFFSIDLYVPILSPSTVNITSSFFYFTQVMASIAHYNHGLSEDL